MTQTMRCEFHRKAGPRTNENEGVGKIGFGDVPWG